MSCNDKVHVTKNTNLYYHRFYFPSQVTPEGHPVSWEGVKAAAHSEVYWDLVRGKNGDNWDVRFSVDEHDVVTYSK